MGVMGVFLPDRLPLRHPPRLAILLLLSSAITVGCLPSSEPSATGVLTPTPPLPLESATPAPPPLSETAAPSVDPKIASAVSGYVVGGGDTTPEGLLDAPRTFVYEVKRDDGSLVHVAYTAYPPSPYGESEGDKIRLDLHAGTVLIGDYLEAHGTYDKSTNTLIVAEEGDYIETYPQKP